MSNAPSNETDAERRALDELLYRGLVERLKHADWYLTGVAIGLESLHRLLDVVELAYREQPANSVAGQRAARLKSVYEALKKFAAIGYVNERAELLLRVRAPLAHL